MKNKTCFIVSIILVLTICTGCFGTNAPLNDASSNTEKNDNTTPGTLLNGVDISSYTIVYSDNDHDYSSRAAKYIQSEIKERTGIELEIQADSLSSDNNYEIVVGETSRKISARLDAETENVQFAILAEEGQIALEGDYFVIAAAAYYFVNTYITGSTFDSTVPYETVIHDPIVEDAKNYIFLIGDGMGVYQTLLFDVMDIPSENNYSDNEDFFYGYMLPYIGYAKTKSLSGVTDSAAAGTALACGYKTVNGYVGKDVRKNDVMSLTELAGSLGMSTAVMSTEVQTGATPSAFSAHANNRSDTSDIITSQNMLKKQYNTIISCNFDYYNPKQISSIESRIVNTLDKLDNNEKGFFIMYEEAYIDKHCHSNDMEKTFLSLIRFNQAIARFMEYAFYNPDTFVLITADHETGSLLPVSESEFAYNSVNHSDFNVQIFTYGDGGELFDGKTIENIQIPKTIAKFWGVDDFGNSSSVAPALTK